MIKTRWAVNTKTHEVFSYRVYDNGDTDFPRGTFLVDRDYLITGMKSKEEAGQYNQDYTACLVCRDAVKVEDTGLCWKCGNRLERNQT